MLLDRVVSYRRRVREALENAIAEEHPPKDVAASFSVGVFVTALPTLGTGLLAFVAIAYYVERASKLALFASVIVLNPVVKWGVYAASFWLGTRLVGPPPDATVSDPSLSAGPQIASRILVGNLVIAVVLTALAYPFALKFVHEVRRRDVDVESVVLH